MGLIHEKLLGLARNAGTLEDTRAAHDAKCLKKAPSTGTVLMAVQNEWSKLMFPDVAEVNLAVKNLKT